MAGQPTSGVYLASSELESAEHLEGPGRSVRVVADGAGCA
jgi:hypothetical protein